MAAAAVPAVTVANKQAAVGPAEVVDVAALVAAGQPARTHENFNGNTRLAKIATPDSRLMPRQAPCRVLPTVRGVVTGVRAFAKDILLYGLILLAMFAFTVIFVRLVEG